MRQIDLNDLECARVSEKVFRCMAEQEPWPAWFAPVVLACFFIAITILALTIYNMRRDRKTREQYRRHDDVPDVKVQLDHRKVE